jgi:hypothetical protein
MSCKYCSQVEVINEFSGKQFFVNMEEVFHRGRGEICIAIDSRGEYVLHYEDLSVLKGDMMSVKIYFCPICGRKLTEEE